MVTERDQRHPVFVQAEDTIHNHGFPVLHTRDLDYLLWGNGQISELLKDARRRPNPRWGRGGLRDLPLGDSQMGKVIVRPPVTLLSLTLERKKSFFSSFTS
mgnify:CR=1 FL=1